MGWAVGMRGGLASALLLALLATAAPGSSLAAAPSRAVVLPGDAHAAVVADVDGDRTNELVRILGDRDVGHVVDVWAFDDDAWRLRGSAAIPELTRSAGDRRIAPGTDASAGPATCRGSATADSRSLTRSTARPSTVDERGNCYA